MSDESQRQPYDSALKSLMEDHAAEMLPEILPESRLISEQNAELARTNLQQTERESPRDSSGG
jgi:hypothetical protein